MDYLNGDTNSTSLEDLSLRLHDNAPGKTVDLTILFDNLRILEKIIIKITQSSQTVAQLDNTKQKGSQFIESLNINSGERSEIEETVELLCEQVETLKLLLYYKELELQEIEQELRDTNENLCAALNSPWLPLDEAKELVKAILSTKKPLGETLATLLSNIYNSTVKPSELGQKEQSNSIKPLISAAGNCRLTNNEVNKTKIMAAALRKQATEIRAKSQMLREQAGEVRSQFREVKAQCMERGIKFVRSQESFVVQESNFKHKQKLKVIDTVDFSPQYQ
ncbi:hypothetical protein NUACC21_55100 [Scytonema sp. NUACC21]